jgi:hypothetical protein
MVIIFEYLLRFGSIQLLSYRYSTGSNLNTYSALIQNFYSQETAPHQAIHVALNTGIEGREEAGVKAYVRSASSRSFSTLDMTDRFNFSAHQLVYFLSQKTVFSYLYLANFDFITQNVVAVCLGLPAMSHYLTLFSSRPVNQYRIPAILSFAHSTRNRP